MPTSMFATNRDSLMKLEKNLLAAFLMAVFLPSLSIAQTADFRFVVEERLAKAEVFRGGKKTIGIRIDEVCDVDNNAVAARVFREYGAMFVAGSGVVLPTKCVFANEAEVSQYQSLSRGKTQNVGGTTITLQEKAMDALLAAVDEAATKRLRISPRGGSLGAKRSYRDTVGLWKSRFNPGLVYWTGKGKISRKDADAARNINILDQVEKVLEWEDRGYFFSKDLRKSILYSVAAPGASQHIFMLALDVEQFSSKAVREILAKHGWFQTVKSDAPHFTYLGVEESKLPSLGLRAETVAGQKFWIPNLD